MSIFHRTRRTENTSAEEYDKYNARQSLLFIRSFSLICTVIISLYCAVTKLFFDEFSIGWQYFLIVPLLLAFLVYAIHELKRNKLSPSRVNTTTMILYIIMTAYFIIMSVFPHPDLPSVYFPLFSIASPVLFYLYAYQQITVSAVSLALFFVLVLKFKSPDCFYHELFEGTTAVLISFVVTVFMARYRRRMESLKNKYYLLSRSDALTGTLNKAAGEQLLSDYISEKKKDEGFTVLFVDIDNFKHYNDTYGHLNGDGLLEKTALLLRSLCSADDSVCRFGGDEFFILMNNSTVADAVCLAEKIVEGVRSFENDNDSRSTCSIGIVALDSADKCPGADEVLRRADSALYTAKENGRDRYELYQ